MKHETKYLNHVVYNKNIFYKTSPHYPSSNTLAPMVFIPSRSGPHNQPYLHPMFLNSTRTLNRTTYWVAGSLDRSRVNRRLINELFLLYNNILAKNKNIETKV